MKQVNTPREKHRQALELAEQEVYWPQYQYKEKYVRSMRLDTAWSQRKSLYKVLKLCGWYWEKNQPGTAYWLSIVSDVPW